VTGQGFLKTFIRLAGNTYKYATKTI